MRLVGFLVLAVVLSAATCSGVGDSTRGPAGFDWSMPDRFGIDGDGDGRIDVPNTFEYVHGLAPGSCAPDCAPTTPVYPVVLTPLEPGDSHSWTISGDRLDQDLEATTSGMLQISLPEGDYHVEVVTETPTGDAVSSGPITVKNVLVVSIGDSYASGEGNPELREVVPGRFFDEPSGVWADDGTDRTDGVAYEHRRAHRSTLAAAAQAALALEAADDKTSVTFVFLAGSGAEIRSGILGPHPGVPYEAEGGGVPDLPPQLDRLEEILGCDAGSCDRVIDHLAISIGGNDIGFWLIWGGLMGLDPDLTVGGAYGLLKSGLFVEAGRRIESLDSVYDELDGQLRSRFSLDRIYITAYPTATRTAGEGGSVVCESVAGVAPGFEIDQAELAEADERVVDPLNGAIAEAASRNGWLLVDAHLDAFRSHGYCGTAPYEADAYPGNPYPDPVVVPEGESLRWFRQAPESAIIQGVPDTRFFQPDTMATRGTMHPNEFGHQVIKDALLAAMRG